jgi:hypothetical protein
MNWDAIGAIAEVFGVVAILVSLIYVAKQIHQSNKIAEAETERDLYHHWMLGLESLVADKWTTETLLRGLADFDSLTSVEQTRLSYKFVELNAIYASMLEMADKGLVSRKLSDQCGDVIFSYIMTPGGRRWWELTGPFQVNKDIINRRIDEEGDSFPGFLETLPYHVIEDDYFQANKGQ